MARDDQDRADEQAREPGGSTLVPAPRRSQVSLHRGIRIEDLAEPESWDLLWTSDEPPPAELGDALEDAADRAAAGGSPLDDELRRSMAELVRSLPPVAVPPEPPAETTAVPAEAPLERPRAPWLGGLVLVGALVALGILVVVSGVGILWTQLPR